MEYVGELVCLFYYWFVFNWDTDEKATLFHKYKISPWDLEVHNK